MQKKRLPSKQEERKKQLDAQFKKYFSKKYIIIALVLVIAILIFKQKILGIALMAVFLPLSKMTVRVTQYVPHVTIETYTSSAIMMTFLYGPDVGMLSALILGLYGYFGNGITKFKALLNVVVLVITAFIAGTYLMPLKLSFSTFFIFAVVIDNVIAYFVFLTQGDMFENITYRTTHTFLNALVYRIFFVLIYNIIHPFL